MAAYYNEIEPYAAGVLRRLIDKKQIPAGDVDERDIRDVTPGELVSYTQCHFFAGIGGWPYALRLAGWPDDRPAWTGSCPCQSFSAAGRGKGGADERHLWPYWFHIIRVCKPPVIFGEQVASKLALSWLDLVFDDLETEGYACGSADLCAAGVGAPHIRQRLWFVAYAEGDQCSWSGISWARGTGLTDPSPTGELADTNRGMRHRRQCQPEREAQGRIANDGTGEVGNFWQVCEWLPCRDRKWRPTKPGLSPLAHGVSGRVARLKAIGNSIVPQLAAEFIRSICE